MPKNKLLILAAVVILLLAGASALLLLRGDEDTWLCTGVGWVKHGRPTAAMPTSPCPSNLKVENSNPDSNINVALANPASQNCLDKTGRLEGLINENGQFNICIFKDDTRCEEWAYYRGDCQPGKNIIVFSPQPNSEVTLPLKVSGQARVFESTFNYRLKDKNGKILTSGIAMADSPDAGQFGNFEIIINSLLVRPTGTDVILEIFDASAKDGSEIDLTAIPLKLTLPQTIILKVYFSNDQLDPKISCDKVFPVERIVPKTASVGKVALEQLLAGLSNEEYQQGYRTNINGGVKLNSLVIADGTAKADFDQTLDNQVGGSCHVTAIRAQIIQTLKQFSSVNQVIISVAGRSADILQP